MIKKIEKLMAHENSRSIGYFSKEINNFDSHIVCTKE